MFRAPCPTWLLALLLFVVVVTCTEAISSAIPTPVSIQGIVSAGLRFHTPRSTTCAIASPGGAAEPTITTRLGLRQEECFNDQGFRVDCATWTGYRYTWGPSSDPYLGGPGEGGDNGGGGEGVVTSPGSKSCSGITLMLLPALLMLVSFNSGVSALETDRTLTICGSRSYVAHETVPPHTTVCDPDSVYAWNCFCNCMPIDFKPYIIARVSKASCIDSMRAVLASFGLPISLCITSASRYVLTSVSEAYGKQVSIPQDGRSGPLASGTAPRQSGAAFNGTGYVGAELAAVLTMLTPSSGLDAVAGSRLDTGAV